MRAALPERQWHGQGSELREDDMQWETPWFIDLPMNSEIGAYQDDFGDEDHAPRVGASGSAPPAQALAIGRTPTAGEETTEDVS
jgi:hypothetical protein